MDADDEENFVVRCALCGTTEGDASNLSSQTTLQTNTNVRCGHMFCNTCVERELVRRREFPCPICKTPVKRVNLKKQSLDAVQCEKDSNWRKHVLSIYNKTEKDFGTLLEYNDYLEDIEDKIYAIVNEEPEAERYRAELKEYEQQHKAQIVIRQSQRADEHRSVQDRIDAEQRLADESRKAIEEEERAVAAAKKRFKTETAEVMLGEREEVSAEVKQAQMQGYRNELRRQRAGKKAVANFVSPRVREPKDGLMVDKLDKTTYLKRQQAGGGLAVDNIASNERAMKFAENSLFASMMV